MRGGKLTSSSSLYFFTLFCFLILLFLMSSSPSFNIPSAITGIQIMVAPRKRKHFDIFSLIFDVWVKYLIEVGLQYLEI